MTDPDKPTPFEIPEQMREFADKSVAQARKAFDDFVDASQKAAASAEEGATIAQTQATQLNRQALEYAEENVSAAMQFAQQLVRAKNLGEVMDMQSQYLKSQMTALGEQTRALSDSVSKSAREAAKTMKS